MQTVNLSSHRNISSIIPCLLQQGAAALFGVAILFIVGFLPMDAVHNAAHDTRHSYAFPCH